MGEPNSPGTVTLEVPVTGPPPYRPWWPAITLGASAALLLAIGVLFALITSVQRADRSDALATRSSQRIECRAIINAEITAREQTADNAEHELLVEIVRQIVTPDTDRDLPRLLDAADRVDVLNDATTEMIRVLQDYVERGSPLPCPLTER